MNSQRSAKRKPTHPGAILREDVLPELNITQTELAERLGVSRRTISEIINEKRPLTIDMAIRLARFFGQTPDVWINMQITLDIWSLQNRNAKEYAKIKQMN